MFSSLLSQVSIVTRCAVLSCMCIDVHLCESMCIDVHSFIDATGWSSMRQVVHQCDRLLINVPWGPRPRRGRVWAARCFHPCASSQNSFHRCASLNAWFIDATGCSSMRQVVYRCAMGPAAPKGPRCLHACIYPQNSFHRCAIDTRSIRFERSMVNHG